MKRTCVNFFRFFINFINSYIQYIHDKFIYTKYIHFNGMGVTFFLEVGVTIPLRSCPRRKWKVEAHSCQAKVQNQLRYLEMTTTRKKYWRPSVASKGVGKCGATFFCELNVELLLGLPVPLPHQCEEDQRHFHWTKTRKERPKSTHQQ
jgi:hypothetical protein